MPVNSANKSVSVEGHYFSPSIRPSLEQERGWTEDCLPLHRDRSLDLNEDTKEVCDSFWEEGRSQWHEITPEKREQAV